MRRVFLAHRPCAIYLSGEELKGEYVLPVNLRLMVVAPQPAGLEKTGAPDHLRALKKELERYDTRLTSKEWWMEVDTWELFMDRLQTYKPHLIYYYGHGVGDEDTVRLCFAEGVRRKRKDVPVLDFATELRKLKSVPLLVYVNCCQGAAGGILGVGPQLCSTVPAVVTNRAVADVAAAQAQATAFWLGILCEGQAPHQAIADLGSRRGGPDLTSSDPRWFTPVLYRQYLEWRAEPRPKQERSVSDPHWHVKVDRVRQYSTVATDTRRMLREGKPKSLAYLWYGLEGEGVEIFHDRLERELKEDVTRTDLVVKCPEWPCAPEVNFERCFREMLERAFPVDDWDQMPHWLRQQSKGVAGRNTLLLLRHQTIVSPSPIHLGVCKRYLEWWDAQIAPLLKLGQFALLGLSFVVKDPVKFQQVARTQERLPELSLAKTWFCLLDQMEKLAEEDLLGFLVRHDIKLPAGRRDSIIEAVLSKTGGHYERTIEELRSAISKAWDLQSEPGPSENSGVPDYNY